MDRGHKMINDANDWQKQFVISSSQHTLNAFSSLGAKTYTVPPEFKFECHHGSLSQILSLEPTQNETINHFEQR